MFFLALLVLILLVAVALVLIVQNSALLFSGVSLTLFNWHLPDIPILVLFLLGALIGGLLLYSVSIFAAWRDRRNLKVLRAQVEELEEEKAQAMQTANNAAPANFASPAVPLPGFVPPPGPPGPNSPLGQRQPLPNTTQQMSPSTSGNAFPLPPEQRLVPPNPAQQMPPSSSGATLPLSPEQRQPPTNTVQQMSPSPSRTTFQRPPGYLPSRPQAGAPPFPHQ